MSLKPKNVVKAIQLLKELMSGRALSAKMSAHIIGTEQASARDYLKVMEELLPEVSKAKEAGVYTWRFVWPHKARVPPETLAALAVSRALSTGIRGSSLDEHLKTLQSGLQRRLHPSPAGHDLSRRFFTHNIFFPPSPQSRQAIDLLVQAIIDQRVIKADYAPFRGDMMDSVELHPYTIVFSRNGLYCLGLYINGGREALVGQVHPFSVRRFKKISMKDDAFAYPTDDEYHPRTHLQGRLGISYADEGPQQIRLRFPKTWKTYWKNQKLHPSQEVEQDSDGILLTFRLQVTYDLVHWVRGHGSDVEVLEPDSLRDWVVSGRSFLGTASAPVEEQQAVDDRALQIAGAEGHRNR